MNRPVTLISIGEFSKMTYLSVKALRHYHDVGLLEPALIDASTGYRQYTVDQIAKAQAIRRFRELDMPIDDVRTVLQSPDAATRNRTILAHLERMQQQLEQTQTTVQSLHTLLSGDATPHGTVEIRRIPTMLVLAATKVVDFDTCGVWLVPALEELHARAAASGLEVVGPDGALYSDDIFADEIGEVTAYVPIAADRGSTGLHIVELPAITAAVLLHEGPLNELDQAYAALGAVVSKRGIGGPGPIREHYLAETRTEVCWPATATTTTTGARA